MKTKSRHLFVGLTAALLLGAPLGFAGATLGLAPVAAIAQEAPAHEHMHRFEHMLKGLNLSDEQKDKIRAIMKQARAKNRDADAETRHANMKEAFAEIDQVLTPEQRDKLHAKMKAWHEKHEQREQHEDEHMSPSSPEPANQ